MRSYLEAGSEICLQAINSNEDKTFHIEKPIGSGATSLVYDAYIKTHNGKKPCRLKELFPMTANVFRDGKIVTWNNLEEKAVHISRFIEIQECIDNFQYADTMGNNAVKVLDIYQGNGTAYVVMDMTYGTVYSEDDCDSLERIIETILVLTKIVREYHNAGYLHLDIKPENFMVCYEPNIWIWMFDFDTVTPIEDIYEGRVKSVPYSPGWEAPEQRLGMIKSIGPSTDIFAIGSILFYKLMGRKVVTKDTSIFADWEFKGIIFEEINPKIIRLLKNILRKTLAGNVKRRYQTLETLILDLKEVLSILAAGKPFLMDYSKIATSNFIGRYNELKYIRQQFENGARAVFLHGDGGIGKSSLAIRYGEQYKNEYDAVIFMRYRDSLEQLVDEKIITSIQNCDTEDTNSRRKIARNLIDEHTLLIVDNFDVAIDDEEFLVEFLEYKGHIIFTTRTDFSTVLDGMVSQIEVKGLPCKDLLSFFEDIIGASVSDDELPSFKVLVDTVEGNTYMLELFAKYVRAQGCSIHSFAKIISDGIFTLGSNGKVSTIKDDKIQKKTIPEILKKLFDLTKLSEVQQQVMRNLYVLRFLKVTRDQYLLYTWEEKDIDVINDLVELGWIKSQDNHYFTLHPLVEELILNELKPDDTNCFVIYHNIKGKIKECIEYEYESSLSEHKLENEIELINNFFYFANYKVKCNKDLVIGWLDGLLKNEENFIYRAGIHSFDLLLKQLEIVIKKGLMTVEEECMVHYFILVGWINEAATLGRYNLDGERDTEYDVYRLQQLIDTYHKFKRSLSNLGENREAWERKTYSCIEDLLNTSYINITDSSFVDELFHEYNENISITTEAKLKYNLPLTEEETLSLRHAHELKESQEKEEWQIEEELKQSYIDKFIQHEDMLEYIKMLSKDDSLTIFERTKQIDACMDHIFWRLHVSGIKNRKALQLWDWEDVEKMLEIEDELLYHDDCECQSKEDLITWHIISNYHDINMITIYAINNNIEFFKIEMESYIERLWDNIKHKIDSRRSHWYHFMKINHLSECNFYVLLSAFGSIGKIAYIMPYVLEFSEKICTFVKEKEDFEEEDLFEMYESLKGLSLNASFEKEIPEEFDLDYYEIEEKYEKLMEDLVGDNYILNRRE